MTLDLVAPAPYLPQKCLRHRRPGLHRQSRGRSRHRRAGVREATRQRGRIFAGRSGGRDFRGGVRRRGGVRGERPSGLGLPLGPPVRLQGNCPRPLRRPREPSSRWPEGMHRRRPGGQMRSGEGTCLRKQSEDVNLIRDCVAFLNEFSNWTLAEASPCRPFAAPQHTCWHRRRHEY